MRKLDEQPKPGHSGKNSTPVFYRWRSVPTPPAALPARPVPYGSLFLGLSLVLHLGLFLPVHPWISPFPEKPPEPIEIAFEPPAPKSKARPRSPAPAGSTHTAHRDKPELSLSDLGIQKVGQAGSSGAETGKGKLAYGSGGSDVLEQLRGTVTYRAIYERIEEALLYPPELVENGIEGLVRATLIFSSEGGWLKKRSPVRASSSYLRVLVSMLLRHVFREPLPRTYFRDGQELKIECVFQFEVSGNGIADSAQGNHFTFHRAGHAIGEWKIGPFAGYGIFPGVGIDTEWLQERVSDALSKRVKPDPLKKYRDDPDWTE